MASVMKILNNLKSGHLHSKKSAPSSQPKETTPREEPEDGPNDLLNRRRVSISKSGRYRENHKRRIALRDASSRGEDGHDARHKDDKNKENEKNKLNCAKRESDLDGHAVADEIASLAKTIENGTATDLALT